MRVKIIIQDNKKAQEAERMGLEHKPEYSYTDFWFKDNLLESFWVDESDGDIVFSLNGDDYRTPYTDKLFQQFKEIV